MSQMTSQVDDEMLDQEMRAWAKRRIRLQRERIQRSGEPVSESEECYEANLRKLCGDDFFYVYQNNFWIAIKMAFQYLADDGTVKPEHASSRQTVQAFHLLEIRQIVLELGYDPEIILGLGMGRTRD